MRIRQINEILQPLIGHYVWNVTLTQGSMLGLNFGEPHLNYFEPKTPKNVSKEIIERFAHRRIEAGGEYSVVTLNQIWTLETKFQKRTSNDVSHDNYQPCFSQLSGQKCLVIEGKGDDIIFLFDLGARLTFHFDLQLYDDELRDGDCFWIYTHKKGIHSYSINGGIEFEASSKI